MRRAALVMGLLLVGCGRTAPLPPWPTCALSVEPRQLDFGDVSPGKQLTLPVVARNEGAARCTVDTATLGASNDATFSLDPLTLPVVLPPGATATVKVTFAAGAAAQPFDRRGTLTLTSSDPGEPKVTVELSAHVVYCEVSAAPDPYDFGNVALNFTANGNVTLRNSGDLPCDLTQVALAPATDSHFTLPSNPGALHLQPSASANLAVRFEATDSAPPHLRTGAITFQANDAAVQHQVPLSAFVNTICTEAGQFIFTVDNNGRFSRFDPLTLTYLDIAALSCPTAASPFSMNVDQAGFAWVIFGDGNLFRVDTANGACTATSYVPGQFGFLTFGMGSMWNSQTATDTLFISGNAGTDSPLGTIAFPSLQVSSVGTIAIPSVELAGTGDGQLWAFSPANIAGGVAQLAKVNPASGAVLEQYDLPTVTSAGGWAIKFFGGAFYIFIGTDVWKVDRASLDPTSSVPTVPPQRVLVSPGRDIVGAGVSTCAPVH